jgi:hypothetical protein
VPEVFRNRSTTHEVVEPYERYNKRVSGYILHVSGFLKFFRPSTVSNTADSSELVLREPMRFDCGVRFCFEYLSQEAVIGNDVLAQWTPPSKKRSQPVFAGLKAALFLILAGYVLNRCQVMPWDGTAKSNVFPPESI